MTAQHDDYSDDEDLTGCRPPLWLIIIALGMVVVTAVFGVRLFGVVWGLVFPPDAPRPDAIVELAHKSLANGVDEWRYQTPLSPCEVIAFYTDAGGACALTSTYCADDGPFTPPVYEQPYLAECTHVEPFSIFALRWLVTVDTTYNPRPQTTTFTLFSEVLWDGMPESEP
jgi:hypothetical protein